MRKKTTQSVIIIMNFLKLEIKYKKFQKTQTRKLESKETMDLETIT